MELFRKRKKENEPESAEGYESAENAESAEDYESAESTGSAEDYESAESTGSAEVYESTESTGSKVEEAPEEEPGEDKQGSEAPEELTLPALLETLSPEGVELFRKALAEAEVRGRNTAVEEHLLTIDDSDGVPHPGCGQGASLRNRPASIFDLARMARQ